MTGPLSEKDLDAQVDNPAGRLAFFLRKLSRQALTAAPSNNAWESLGDLFGLAGQDFDFAKTLDRMAGVLDLPNQIEKAVMQSPEVSDKFIELLPDVRQFLQTFMSNMQSSLQRPQENLITMMELISEQLSRFAPEPQPDPEELFVIREEIDGLLRSVLDSQIDRDLAQFIADHLHSLLEAIDTYHISGVASIRSAISELIGDVEIRAAAGGFSETSDESVTVGLRLWDLINKLSAVISLPAAGIAISNFTTQALAAGPPPHLH